MYLAERLVRISSALTSCHLNSDFQGDWEESGKQKVVTGLALIEKEAWDLSLPVTAKTAARLKSEARNCTGEEMFDRITELEDRFNLEIEGFKFFLVKAEVLRLVDNPELAGEPVKSKFPNANTELMEAGNCLAFDRYTACVCHCMRSLDIVLTALERQLGIPLPASGHERTWGKILGRIADKIKDNDKTPPPDWVKGREFYEQARVFLHAVKAPYRDSTMHVKCVYDEQGATSVFNVTVEALRHLAINLAE
jgi:hypothetical protein